MEDEDIPLENSTFQTVATSSSGGETVRPGVEVPPNDMVRKAGEVLYQAK